MSACEVCDCSTCDSPDITYKGVPRCTMRPCDYGLCTKTIPIRDCYFYHKKWEKPKMEVR